MSLHKTYSLFLSVVSNEFRSYRKTLTEDLRRPNLDIKVQEDFSVTGGTTLEKLDEYIQHCHGVIHLIGRSTGSFPKSPEVSQFLERYQNFFQRVPLLDAAERANPAFSYTQWEAYLALYHQRPLYIFRAKEEAPRDETFVANENERQQQEAHFDRLCKLGRDRGEFENPSRLSVAVLRSIDFLSRFAGPESSPSNIANLDSVFVGRKRELDQLVDYFVKQRCGLVTITGTGGIGKTRLACEAALVLSASFPGGCYLVKLKELIELVDVTTAVADALGLRLDQKGEATEVLGRLLKDREPTLLVLDNFERITGLAKQTVEVWRRLAPQISILVTSRKALGITGEMVDQLGALELPPPLPVTDLAAVWAAPSVQLFRATVAGQQIQLPEDEQTATLVINICRQLEGQPLALLLVARRSRSFSLERLSKAVDTHRVRAANAYGETLDETIAWSYKLLTDKLPEAFQRLCVFREGFDVEAAEAILNDVEDNKHFSPLDFLQDLIEWSFVEVVRHGQRIRYQLFQTIQDFGRDRWPTPRHEPVAWALQWLTHYVTYTEHWSKLIRTVRSVEALDLLVEERENVVAAHAWGLKNQQEVLATRLLLAFAPVLEQRGPWQKQSELYQLTFNALPTTEVALRIRLLNAFSEARWCAGDYEQAKQLAQQAVDAAENLGDDELLAQSLLELAEATEKMGHRADALQLYLRGHEVATRCAAHVLMIAHDIEMAYIHDRAGDYEQALKKIARAKLSSQQTANLFVQARLANREGLIYWHLGQPEAALGPLASAADLFAKADNPRWQAGVITNIGLALIDADRLDDAVQQFSQAAPLHRGQGNNAWWAVNQGGHGMALIQQRKFDETLLLLTEAFEVACQSHDEENIALIHALRGRAWNGKQEWQKAEAELSTALTIEDRIQAKDRRHAANFIQRSFARFRLGRRDEAKADLDSAREQIERLQLRINTFSSVVRADLQLAADLEEFLA